MQRFGYPVCGVKMKYRAVIKKSGDWWIGWLVDLHGVNRAVRNPLVIR